MKWVSWIASAFLAFSAVSLAWNLANWARFTNSPMPTSYWLVSAALLLSAALLFPPLWRGEKSHWKWPRIVIATLIAAVTLFMPIQTHAVKLDMPRPVQGK